MSLKIETCSLFATFFPSKSIEIELEPELEPFTELISLRCS